MVAAPQRKSSAVTRVTWQREQPLDYSVALSSDEATLCETTFSSARMSRGSEAESASSMPPCASDVSDTATDNSLLSGDGARSAEVL